MIPPRALEIPVSLGPNATVRDVTEVIAGIGCPFCRSLAGHYCTDPKTGRASHVHVTRVKCWQRRQRRGAR